MMEITTIQEALEARIELAALRNVLRDWKRTVALCEAWATIGASGEKNAELRAARATVNATQDEDHIEASIAIEKAQREIDFIEAHLIAYAEMRKDAELTLRARELALREQGK